MTHICVGKLIIIGSDNGLSPDRRQAIIWTNAGLLSIGSLRTYFNENLIKNATIFIDENARENVVCEMASIYSRPQCVKTDYDCIPGSSTRDLAASYSDVTDNSTVCWAACLGQQCHLCGELIGDRWTFLNVMMYIYVDGFYQYHFEWLLVTQLVPNKIVFRRGHGMGNIFFMITIKFYCFIYFIIVAFSQRYRPWNLAHYQPTYHHCNVH